ncbi:hypothetical protein D3H55_04580 [Bacillus salacetis]|uniref:Uncharacterized protein n=1 Tax=Bacillus salacetis TaxID=2315464 RepID=A0A3A1R3M7_9BACI|nr:hypothetical protein [Bacillus salacetis]RIW37318.1 hypothetical protein D3H55_04580 [Bacillus salacetis]
MAARENRFQRLSHRRSRREDPSIGPLRNRRSGKDSYPSSFFSQPGEESEKYEEDQQVLTKKTGGPLILPPPPITSNERKKKREPEPVEILEEFLPKKKKDEIIPLPEDDDELIYEKRGALMEQHGAEDLQKDIEEETQDFHHEESEDQTLIEESEPSVEEEEEAVYPENIEPSPKYICANLPVLLMKDEFTLDVFDSFTLLIPLTAITKIEWSVHDFKGCIPLPSNKIFLELVLCADIEFNSQQSGSLQSVKIYVPLQKTVSVNWLSEPELPFTRSGEYDFSTDNGISVSTHRVWEEKLVSPATVKLQSYEMLSHDKLAYSKREKAELGVLGTIKIALEAVQEQTVLIQV